MNALAQAILEGTPADVRRVAKQQPHLLDQATASGSTPLRVALGKSNPLIVIVLLRAGAREVDLKLELGDLLSAAIHWICQDLFCASWLQEFEYELWGLVTHDPRVPLRYTQFAAEGALPFEVLSDLEWLSTEADCWRTWMDGAGDCSIPRTAWGHRYREWIEHHLGHDSLPE